MTISPSRLGPVMVVLSVTLVAGPAVATAAVSLAELDGSKLRIEGTAVASRDITVDGVVMARSDSSGRFRVQRDSYTPPADCTVDVNDGSPTATSVRLSGCTVTQTPPAADTTAPTAPTSPTATVVGTTISLGWGMSFDDTGVAGYRVTRNGSLVATTTSASHVDSGLAAGTYTYTIAAFDAAGNTSAQSPSVSATVQADEGLYFITPAQMPDAHVGEAYLGYIVCSDPAGPSTFKFKLVSGTVPDGTRFSGNTLENRPEARVIGTPTRSGTFSFTVEVKDNTGATARRTFSIRVLSS